MADGYGIDQIEALIEQRIQQGYGFDPSKLNDAAQEILRTMEKIYDRTAQDPNGFSAKEINAAMKEIRDFLKSSGATTKETATYISNWTNELKGLIKSGVIIDKTRFQHSVNANISNMMGLHILDPSKKSAQNNLLAQTLQKGYGKIEKKMDSIIEKLLYLCNMADKEEARENQKEGQEGKKKRQFIDDLVEGLARSKFVGGAFTDLVRLATFFAASWLKNHGLLGKALAVGLVALGPVIGTAIASILTKALVGGITNVLKTGLLSLGTLLKATFMSFFKREAFASALGAKGSTVLGMSRGNIALGAALAAVGVGAMAADTWKQGGARNRNAAVAMGVGSAAFGTAAIAALLPALAPIAPIALAVATIATGIGLVVKFWPKISEFFTNVLEKLGIIAKKDEKGEYKSGGRTLVENIGGAGKPGKSTKLTSQTDTHQLSKSELAAWNKANTAKADFSNTGLLLNAGEMTQERANQQLQEYLSNDENRKKFLKNYELAQVDKGRIRSGDYATDLIYTDPKTGITYVVNDKGTEDFASQMEENLTAAGYKGKLYQTSSKRTAGNFALKLASTHQAGGEHDRILGWAKDFVYYNEKGQKVTDKTALETIFGTALGSDNLKGTKVKVHGVGAGLKAIHGHIYNYMSKENRQNWENFQKGLKSFQPKEEISTKEAAVRAAELNLEIAQKKLTEYNDSHQGEAYDKNEQLKLKKDVELASFQLADIDKNQFDLNNNNRIDKNEKGLDWTDSETVSKVLSQLKYYSVINPEQQ